ncbi:MAG: hypothetical protein ACXVSE_06545 [Solirubrobacteraceae bacterium]
MLGHSVSTANTYELRGLPLVRSGTVFAPSVPTRLRARARRLELDRALADGTDPAGSPLLAARAAQLVGRANRYRLAAALEHLALTADAPPRPFRTAPRRGAVEANRAALMELAATLRAGGLLYARGVAILELVMIDGSGPAYSDAHGEGLARQLALAGAGLGG